MLASALHSSELTYCALVRNCYQEMAPKRFFSSFLDKVHAVIGLIFCACDNEGTFWDGNGNEQISKTEIEDEDCVAIQKSVFHDNYITEGGFDSIRKYQTDADNSYFTLAQAEHFLGDLIDEQDKSLTPEYHKLFTGETGKIITGENLTILKT